MSYDARICCPAGNPRQGATERQLNGQHRSFHFRQGWNFSRACSLLLLCCVLLIIPHVEARRGHGASELLPRELLFDRSEPPLLRLPLVARQDASSTATINPETTTTTATGSSIQTAAQTGATSLPRPFDSSIGTNFTSPTCPQFFNDFLSNQTFNECLPFSLLLQTSNGFFAASQSLVRLTQILDVTCKVDFTKCSAAMAGWAQEIQRDDRCGEDLDMGNPVVRQAYYGFVAYKPLYQAGCLQDTGGNYCFANAATNASAPTSSYIYYLPLGVQLYGGVRPACTSCLQNTMAIFAEAADNTSQPLNGDYAGASGLVNMICGPSFVRAATQTSAAVMTTTVPYALGGLLILVAFLTGL